MADNRQILIHLHSATGNADAAKAVLNMGELAINHSNATDAKIFTKVEDGRAVATFITDLAVDAKVKVVNDALTQHVNAYESKITLLDAKDSAHDQSIESINTSITNINAAIGENGLAGRLTAVESVASANTSAISAETEAREAADAAEAKARKDADDALLGTSADDATKKTIYGAHAAASNAQQKADNVESTLNTFLEGITPDGAENIIDTLKEINDYVSTHTEAFTTLSGKVSDNTSAISAETEARKAAVSAETEARKEAVEGLQTAIDAKANAADVYTKTDADAKFETIANVTTKVNAVSAAISAETEAREAADAAEAKTRQEADANLQTAIDAKANTADVYTKTDADAKFETIANVTTKVNDVSAAVSAETEARVAADAAEAKTRDDADKALQTAIDGINGAAAKSGLITSTVKQLDGTMKTYTINGTVVENVLKFDFSTIVIDCGTF